MHDQIEIRSSPAPDQTVACPPAAMRRMHAANLLHDHAAVDGVGLAGDVGRGGVHGEEAHQAGHLLGLPVAACWQRGCEGGAGVGGRRREGARREQLLRGGDRAGGSGE
jgi:hypothetical protein